MVSISDWNSTLILDLLNTIWTPLKKNFFVAFLETQALFILFFRLEVLEEKNIEEGCQTQYQRLP